MPASKAQQAQVAERRRQAIELRLAGVPVLQIAIQLDYAGGRTRSEKVLTDLVYQDLNRAIEQRRRRVDEAAGNLADLHELRLERLLAVYMQRALTGDVPAGYLCVRILERQAKLRGIDAPIQVHATVTGEEDADLAALVNEFEELLDGRRAIDGGPAELPAAGA